MPQEPTLTDYEKLLVRFDRKDTPATVMETLHTLTLVENIGGCSESNGSKVSDIVHMSFDKEEVETLLESLMKWQMNLGAIQSMLTARLMAKINCTHPPGCSTCSWCGFGMGSEESEDVDNPA